MMDELDSMSATELDQWWDRWDGMGWDGYLDELD